MTAITAAITEITGFAHLQDLPCYQLSFGEATAVVSRYGGQVLSYQPSPGQELLWLSPLAAWQQQQPIRGGVPVCWPWFGAAASQLNPAQLSLPNHGLVRTRFWTLQQQAVTTDAVELCLSITLDEFPDKTIQSLSEVVAPTKPTELRITLRLTHASLSINLSCDPPLLQQAALHSYFKITDLIQTQIKGIGEQYRDKVRQNQLIFADPELKFNKEIDRIYSQPAAELRIENAEQTLAILQQGFDSTVVWNPAAQRCAAIADLADDSYQYFVCVETASLDLSQPKALCLTQQVALQPNT